MKLINSLLCTLLTAASPSLLIASTFDWPSTLFEDQFENRTLDAWNTWPVTGSNTLIKISEAQSVSGYYSVAVTVPPQVGTRSGYLNKRFQPNPVIYAQFWMYLERNVTIENGSTAEIFRFEDLKIGSTLGVRLKQAGGKGTNLVISLYGGAEGTNVLARNKWHCIEIMWKGGNGSGERKIWLNGLEEVAANGLVLTNTPYYCRMGYYSLDYANTNSQATLYFDDVVLSTNSIGYNPTSAKIYHPDVRGRLGAPIIAVTRGALPGDSIIATLSNTNGYSNVVAEKRSINWGRIDFPLFLTNLPVSQYRLEIRLLDSLDAIRCRATYVFDKPYEKTGSFTIDAMNNFWLNGRKFFPVLPFCIGPSDYAMWARSNYINMALGQNWSPQTMASFASYINTAASQGFNTIGPVNVGSTYAYYSETNWENLTNLWANYLNSFKTNAMLAAWQIFDEPELHNYTREHQKAWWDMQKTIDPSRPMMFNMMGPNWTGYNENRRDGGHQWSYPWLVADIYSHDLYPVENPSFSISQNAIAVANASLWNYGLVPVMSFVQLSDTLPNGGGIPTAQQVEAMAWAMVCGGAKGVEWFRQTGIAGSQSTNPPLANYNAAANFTREVTALTEAILADEAFTVGVLPPVHAIGRFLDGTNWVFAVNTDSNKVNGFFSVGAVHSGQVLRVHPTGTIRGGASGFSDELEPLTHKIYCWKALPSDAMYRSPVGPVLRRDTP